MKKNVRCMRHYAESEVLSNYNGDKHLTNLFPVLSNYKDFEFMRVRHAPTDSSRKVIEN